jgi:hypothetical protein
MRGEGPTPVAAFLANPEQMLVQLPTGHAAAASLLLVS